MATSLQPQGLSRMVADCWRVVFRCMTSRLRSVICTVCKGWCQIAIDMIAKNDYHTYVRAKKILEPIAICHYDIDVVKSYFTCKNIPNAIVYAAKIGRGDIIEHFVDFTYPHFAAAAYMGAAEGGHDAIMDLVANMIPYNQLPFIIEYVCSVAELPSIKRMVKNFSTIVPSYRDPTIAAASLSDAEFMHCTLMCAVLAHARFRARHGKPYEHILDYVMENYKPNTRDCEYALDTSQEFYNKMMRHRG